MFYAPSTKGFYDPEINTEIPVDAIELTRERYLELYDGIARGLVLAVVDGVLSLVDAPPLADDVLADLVRAERDSRLSKCDWTQLPDATADKQQWAAYRQALRDVPSQAGFPQNIDWPVTPE